MDFPPGLGPIHFPLAFMDPAAAQLGSGTVIPPSNDLKRSERNVAEIWSRYRRMTREREAIGDIEIAHNGRTEENALVTVGCLVGPLQCCRNPCFIQAFYHE